MTVHLSIETGTRIILFFSGIKLAISWIRSPAEVDGKISVLMPVQTFHHGGRAILVKRNAEVSDAGYGAKVGGGGTWASAATPKCQHP
jgi:hypothetical protein